MMDALQGVSSERATGLAFLWSDYTRVLICLNVLQI